MGLIVRSSTFLLFVHSAESFVLFSPTGPIPGASGGLVLFVVVSTIYWLYN